MAPLRIPADCEKRRGHRLDFIQLLAEHGAATSSIPADEVISCRDPAIIRWFLNRGLDLEEGYPIARAFRDHHRDFLGIYMDVRDKVPSARMQAAMALRYHVREGNLKWVSLLLWAGARAPARGAGSRKEAS